MAKCALFFGLLLSLFFISCEEVAIEQDELNAEEPRIPIVQVADTLTGSEGQVKEFHISDFFYSEAPILKSELFSENLRITSLPYDSFRVAHPQDSIGHFTINAELVNSDEYELSAEMIYSVIPVDSTSFTHKEDSSKIHQTKYAVMGQQGETVFLDVLEYFESQAPVDSVALEAGQVKVRSLGEYRYELSQPEDLFGEVEISFFLRNTDQQTLSGSLQYYIEEAYEAAAITQQKSEIIGQQGNSTEIHINEYFTSEADLISMEFYSEEITIDSLGDGRFMLSQPEDLFGEFKIQATITNSDDITLEAELIYKIEEDSESPAPSEEELVIMPLGDSMTNDPRSRVKLWNLLEADGHNLDYVGNQYQTSSIPDPDHEGVGGIKIGGIMEKTASLMQTHNPKYVTLMVGTNDIAWYFDETAEEIAGRWNELIDLIFESTELGTYIVAATIPPVTSKNVGKPGMSILDRVDMVQQYNAELRKLIEQRKANGDPIILADMEAALSLEEHVSSDGVHLSETGYAIMGTVYYEALNKALNN